MRCSLAEVIALGQRTWRNRPCEVLPGHPAAAEVLVRCFWGVKDRNQ